MTMVTTLFLLAVVSVKCRSMVIDFISVPSDLTDNGLVLYNVSHDPKLSILQRPSFFQPGLNDKVSEKKSTEPKRIICYYNFVPETWNSTALEEALTPELIDPFLCSHINLGFAEVENCSISWHIDSLYAALKRFFTAVRRRNPALKVLLSIGGAGEGGFPEIVATDECLEKFAYQARKFLLVYGLDGLDLDWEFPDEKHLDYINVMTYDFHFYTPSTPLTGLNSPLYRRKDELGIFATYNVNFQVSYWNTLGMPKEKIFVGIPTYGRTFTLADPKNHALYDYAVGPGSEGTYSNWTSHCENLHNKGFHRVFDEESKAPYMYKDRSREKQSGEAVVVDRTIVFASLLLFHQAAQRGSFLPVTGNHLEISGTMFPRYLQISGERQAQAEYIVSQGYGGAMVYCLNADDFAGHCSKGKNQRLKFPGVSTIKQVFHAADGVNKNMVEDLEPLSVVSPDPAWSKAGDGDSDSSKTAIVF
ncbi:unnamed protein product [Cyprideis torosa]|uniref:Uncharacterized protein n=1 Tax=Cyprideis torosa TaxID=163714 RepID=A0A7R8W423_9CRUS|nr:unnamed protein product [Cyprideis torosa]CAG0880200.1 unnamed protein product [Cyprideis torosa]